MVIAAGPRRPYRIERDGLANPARPWMALRWVEDCGVRVGDSCGYHGDIRRCGYHMTVGLYGTREQALDGVQRDAGLQLL